MPAVMTTPTSRPAEPGDDALLRALFAADRPPVLLEVQYAARAGQYAAAWPASVDRILLDVDEPVGRLLTSEQGSEWRLIDVAVLPAARGRGVATRAIRELLSRADGAGVCLSLRVAAEGPARRLYARHGFAVTGDDGVSLTMTRHPRSGDDR